jgi:hypothetical protein
MKGHLVYQCMNKSKELSESVPELDAETMKKI